MSGKVAGSIGIGGVFLFLGVVILGPRLAPRLIRMIGGWLPSVKGVTGRLAVDNATRSPKRTAATTTSLILALTLIGIITVVLSSFTASFNAAVSEGFKGDFQLSAGNSGAVLSPALAARLEKLPQLSAVGGLSVGAGAVLGQGDLVWGADGPGLKQTLDFGVNNGDLDQLVGPNAIALSSERPASLFDKPVGSTIPLAFPSGLTHTFTVVATYDQPGLIGQGLDAKYMLSRAAFAKFEPAQVQTDLRILVKAAPGVSAAQRRGRGRQQVTTAFPTAEVQSLKQIQTGPEQAARQRAQVRARAARACRC